MTRLVIQSEAKDLGNGTDTQRDSSLPPSLKELWRTSRSE